MKAYYVASEVRRGRPKSVSEPVALCLVLVAKLSESDHNFPLTRLHPLLQRATTRLHNNLVPLTLWMITIKTLLNLYLGQVTTHATVDGSQGKSAFSIRQ